MLSFPAILNTLRGFDSAWFRAYGSHLDGMRFALFPDVTADIDVGEGSSKLWSRLSYVLMNALPFLTGRQPFFDRLGCEKELVMLEGCGHFPYEEPGVSQLRKTVEEFPGARGRAGERK